jgi:acetyltransferase-like isoleucine patch superfamily enzyme
MTATSRSAARFLWASVSVVFVETIITGLALAPAVLFIHWQSTWPLSTWIRLTLASLAFTPVYLACAVSLMVYSALATRLLGWRTPANVELPLRDFSWPVLNWGRYLMTIHVVRVFAGPAFRSTTIWNWYMRLNGARIGRDVWVNSLALMDHNLLEFADGVVIGSEAHVSGHVVERGILKTAPVRLGPNTLIGIGTVVGIGVESGAGAQVGALSVVPKFTHLEAAGVYGGVPVVRVH